MSDRGDFTISVERACPACDADCQELEVEMNAVYGSGGVVIRACRCANAERCKRIYKEIEKIRGGGSA